MIMKPSFAECQFVAVILGRRQGVVNAWPLVLPFAVPTFEAAMIDMVISIMEAES